MKTSHPDRTNNKRVVDGILLLNKPKGITSNACLQTAKRLFSALKAGHTGSLDPLATGMLVVCFGEATKFSQFLLNADKRYSVVAQLGVKTTTGDAEGSVIEQREVRPISQAQLEVVLDDFRGEVVQIPSMFSALKHQGEPLYKLARRGLTVERAERTVKIHELTLLQQTPETLSLEINCSKGTYVRTLVEDIGEKLGCGAHVISLHRLSVSTLQEDEMLTLEQIEQLPLEKRDQVLLPLSHLLKDWRSVKLSKVSAYYLLRGQPIIVPHAPTEGWVRLFLDTEQFLGIGEVLSDGRVAPRRLVSTAL